MLHYLLPYFKPLHYYYGLRYFVYWKNRSKARIVHSLWFIALPLALGQLVFMNYLSSIGERGRYVVANTIDADYSVVSIVILILAWIPAWVFCCRIGDRLFLRRNVWAKYSSVPLSKARRLRSMVTLPEWF